jgi:hypothetical protein
MKSNRRERRGTQRRREFHELTRIEGEGERQKDGGMKMESPYVVSYKFWI